MPTVQIQMSDEERLVRVKCQLADILVERDALAERLAKYMQAEQAAAAQQAKRKRKTEPTPIRPPDETPPAA